MLLAIKSVQLSVGLCARFVAKARLRISYAPGHFSIFLKENFQRFYWLYFVFCRPLFPDFWPSKTPFSTMPSLHYVKSDFGL